MMKFKSGHSCTVVWGLALALCLSACQSTQGTTVQPKPQLAPNSVVLLDPSVDDAMLPAIGEGLSKGRVTIYRLDGPMAPSAAGIGVANNPIISAPPIALPPQERITLRAPETIGQGDATRVTIFSPDSGEAMVKKPVPELSPAPKLPAPTTVTPSAELKSPFTTDGMPVSPPPQKRPPKGMTY